MLAFCMFVGRFGVIIPVMAIAGSLVSKKSQPASSGTLPTHGPLFVGLLFNRHRVAGWRTDLYPCHGAWPGGGISLLMILSDAEHPE
ncbi:potassium-transporting ATPase subunit KdpA [Escherichia coli]|nr:potassium-transporting ATPase subunit KdpA [Escherichia coli]